MTVIHARKHSIGILAVAACLVGLAAPAQAQQGRAPFFGAGVTLSDGNSQNAVYWLGGDAPHGTLISPNYSFWGFGDTFLGDPRVSGRHIANPGNSQLADVVGNTIAIGQINSSGNFYTTYFYSGSVANKKGFFPEPATGYRFQVLGSYALRGKLFVFLFTRYTASGSADTNGQYVGTFLARVNNPSAIPTNWSIDYIPVITTPAGTTCQLQLGYNLLPSFDGNTLYVYGDYVPSNVGKNIVCAFDVGTMMTAPAGQFFPQSGVQHLEENGTSVGAWQPGLSSPNDNNNYFDTQIDPIFFSLRWNPSAPPFAGQGGPSGKWQMIGIYGFSAGPGGSGSNQTAATLYLSDSPFGRFRSAPYKQVLPTFPELSNTSFDSANQNIKYCYCAREWVDTSLSQAQQDQQITITYTYDAQYNPYNPDGSVNQNVSNANLNIHLNDNNTYQNRNLTFANPYFSAGTTRAMAAPAHPLAMAMAMAMTGGPGGDLPQSASALEASGLERNANDGFSGPAVAPLLPFPVHVDHPLDLKLPWGGKTLKVKAR